MLFNKSALVKLRATLDGPDWPATGALGMALAVSATGMVVPSEGLGLSGMKSKPSSDFGGGDAVEGTMGGREPQVENAR
jgi:hypothetical protein